jgi:molybdenum cofactor synthesis domain-containing protein
MIAGIAAFGYPKIKVVKRPAVAILSTGSEIVAIDKIPGRDQIRNSNSLMLKVLCERAGASAKMLPIVGDSLGKLKTSISRAAGKADILVITGGVSVGKYDLTKAALKELGAEIYFERVRLKPGKPAVFARLGNTLVFGLPGNPVSSAVTFYLFVRRAIRRMQNTNQVDLKVGNAIAASRMKGARERETYLPIALDTAENGSLMATPLKFGGSSDFVGFAHAEALAVIPKGNQIEIGAVVKIAFL